MTRTVSVRARWLVGLVLVAGCHSSAPCTVALDVPSGADLALHGAGACAAKVRMTLRVATGDARQPTWSDAAAAPVVVDGEWTPRGSAAVARTVSLRNPGATPIDVVGLEWTATGLVPSSATVLLHDGYQSWSYTGVESVPAQLADTAGTVPHGGDNEDFTGELAGVSWWWTFVADAAGQGAMVGATGGTVLKTYVGVERDRVRLVEGVTGDVLTLQPGESRALDGVYVGLGDVGARLDEYAAEVASQHPPAVERHPAVGGWGSWNYYYAMPTADGIRQEMQFAAAELAPRGLTDVLLDDGYEDHWGDWSASASFGATLDGLAGEQANAGLEPAIWLAPFYVATTDPLVAQNPAWFVHRADGSLRTYDNFGPTYAALDVTSAGARDFVVQAVKRYRDWGYRTLKIDFLFGGAVEGVRAQPLTGLESYQRWMQTLREAVPEVHLIGCGAPMLPSVGWVDSMRVGADIAFVTAQAPTYPFIAAMARNVALRAFTDRFWALDPDVVLLRGDAIDDGAAWTAVVAGALAGGNYLVGDARQASGVRRAMALDPEVLAMARDGVAARPVELATAVDDRVLLSPLLDPGGDTQVPHQWSKRSADGAHHWLAVFGWSDGYTARIDLPPGAAEIVPPASDGAAATRSPRSGAQQIEVPAHSARLFTWDG
ncbi:MAG: hypothetical protein ACXVCV_06100 [Polyangia bacterium]